LSNYQQFLNEREKIDLLIQKGYRIKYVNENLSGAFVEFENKSQEEKRNVTHHVLTADARKYFSVILIKQQKEFQRG
jgi:hypothetical protein